MKEMYSLVDKLRPYLLDSKLVAYAAILIDWSFYKPSESFKGFYKTMIETHTPFEVLSKEDIKAGKLEQYKVLVLPDVGYLDREVIEKIETYVSGGGGLVMTHKTSCTDEAGVLQEGMVLGSLAGIEGPFGVVVNPPRIDESIRGSIEYGVLPHNYYVISRDHEIGRKLKNRILSSKGSFLEVEATSTAKVIAQIVDYDYSKMRSSHGVPGWYPYRQQPISPLIVINENKNSGRVVYFAAPLDAVFLREGDASAGELLCDAIKWAGKTELPVQTDCPSTVEIATHYDESRKTFLIFLVNQTSNQLYPDPIRQVVPIKDLTVRLRVERKVKSVRSVTGRSVEYTKEKDSLSVVLSELKEWEAVIIELGS